MVVLPVLYWAARRALASTGSRSVMRHATSSSGRASSSARDGSDSGARHVLR